MAMFQALPWHRGEDLMHRLHVSSDMDNPTAPMLSSQAARMLQNAPLLAIGTLDEDSRPWTSVWGGEAGFACSLAQSIIGIRTPVAARYDPVVEALVGKIPDGGVAKEEGIGRMISGLPFDLASRKRVKIYGRMVAGALTTLKQEERDDDKGEEPKTEVQLVLKIEQSLGNCPKYMNVKDITPAHALPQLSSESPILVPDAVSLIARSDMFFISSRQELHDMDTNHRGGPAGFVRVTSDKTSSIIVWPEYSGNRLYQTLGNLKVTPLAGLCFPDFATGDVLYVTGTTEILTGYDAACILPRSNLAVKLTITAARFIRKGLSFRGAQGNLSPYNPHVRYLKSERSPAETASNQASNVAKLLSQTYLTPNVSRFRFSLENPVTYTAGQYVTLDFSSHLAMGYSHMRDDDPLSINDDFVRTFTVSNPPGTPPKPSQTLQDDEFEITIRRVGPVTNFLFKHGLDRSRRGMNLEVDVKGFGGEFEVKQSDGETIGFIAAGVGITPLLPALTSLDPERLTVIWTLRRHDLGLVVNALEDHPEFAKVFEIFVTGSAEDDSTVQYEAKITESGASLAFRRLESEDVSGNDRIKRWFICTSSPMREALLEWLPGKETIYEDFNF